MTQPTIVFRNKKTGKEFKVVAFDKSVDPPTITMVGSLNRHFTEPYNKERFAALGYELVKLEDATGE